MIGSPTLSRNLLNSVLYRLSRKAFVTTSMRLIVLVDSLIRVHNDHINLLVGSVGSRSPMRIVWVMMQSSLASADTSSFSIVSHISLVK